MQVNKTPSLDETKVALKILWDDDDEELESIITRADGIIRSYISKSINYDASPEIKQLFFDCCRYIRADATEAFQKNYAAQLIILRQQYRDLGDESD